MSDPRYDQTKLVKKTYSDNPKQDAAQIASKCILQGYSNGWSGNHLEDIDEVRRILVRFGIKYTNDMWGEWS